MSKICQFSINNRSDHSNQLTIAMEMIKKVCNREIDEIHEKVVDIAGRWNKIKENVEEAKRE